MLRGRHKVVHRTADEFCPAFRPLQSDQLKARWIHINEPVVHRHGDAFGEEFHDRSITFLAFAQSLLGALFGDANGGSLGDHVYQPQMPLVRQSGMAIIHCERAQHVALRIENRR